MRPSFPSTELFVDLHRYMYIRMLHVENGWTYSNRMRQTASKLANICTSPPANALRIAHHNSHVGSLTGHCKFFKLASRFQLWMIKNRTRIGAEELDVLLTLKLSLKSGEFAIVPRIRALVGACGSR